MQASQRDGWWKYAKFIAGNNKQVKPDRYFVDNQWQSIETFNNNINTYFTTIGGPRQPVDCRLTTTSNREVSIGEVKYALKQINTHKSTNQHDFPSFISHDFAEDIALPMTNIINAIFKQQKFPKLWIQAQVIPIAKCKSPTAYKDYRPITSPWHCGKIAKFST